MVFSPSLSLRGFRARQGLAPWGLLVGLRDRLGDPAVFFGFAGGLPFGRAHRGVCSVALSQLVLADVELLLCFFDLADDLDVNIAL